jgi:4-hydroxybenzoate polyprenyltransferase
MTEKRQEKYEQALKLQKRNQKFATYLLFLSMGTMALWGWTPLKQIVPALPVVVLWVSFTLTSLCLAIFGVYRGMQAKSWKEKIEDA